MKSILKVFNCFVLGVLLVRSDFSYADQLNFGGVIRDVNDNPIASGITDLTLVFFDSKESSDEIFFREFKDVPVNEGRFSVRLQLSPEELIKVQSLQRPLFVEIGASLGQQTYPRQVFSSVPLALSVPIDNETLSFVDGKLSVVIDSLPPKGERGDSGAPGAKGDRGEKGDRGPPGPSVEIDPKVGALTRGKWCTADGSQIQCHSQPPILSVEDIPSNSIAGDKLAARSITRLQLADDAVTLQNLANSEANCGVAGSILIVDSAGEWTCADQASSENESHAFKMVRDSNQNVPVNQNVLIDFSKIEFDDSNDLDITTDEFKPSKPGKYQVTLQVKGTSSSNKSVFGCKLLRGTETVAESAFSFTAASPTSPVYATNCTTLLYLDGNQAVKGYVYGHGYYGPAITLTYGAMSGFFISP